MSSTDLKVLGTSLKFNSLFKVNTIFISYHLNTMCMYTDFHELLLILICAIKTKIKSVSSDVQRTVTWEPVSLALMGDAGAAWEEDVQLLTS